MSEDAPMTQTIEDEQLLDEAWLAAPRRRSRLRVVLAATLAAALCFLGGVLVQQHFGAAETTTAGGLPSGFPGGGVPSGFPGAGGGLPDGAQQGGGGADPPTSSETADAGANAVIGRVVEIDGDVWVVEDLGGKRHEVRVTDQAHLVRETQLTADQVAVGDLVDVTGTTEDDHLVADDVTLR